MFTKKIGVSIFVATALFVFIFGLSKVGATIIIELENSYALCHDNLDNDDNGSSDMADASCAGFSLTSENSFALCHDSIDNDDNGSSDMADASCANFATETVNPILIPENSYALCHDSLDNDDNGSSDMADASCAGFATDPSLILENSFALCHDSIDNDDNGSSDMADASCANFATEITTPTSGGGSSSSSRGGSRRVSKANLASSQGQVLGATTDIADATCAIRSTFLKRGFANSVDEVKKLQTFLNTEMKSGLPITGFFGPLTEQAVNTFQVKYSEEILLPWFKMGLNSSAIAPTGYVYKTTLYKINSLLCPNTTLVYPTLN